MKDAIRQLETASCPPTDGDDLPEPPHVGQYQLQGKMERHVRNPDCNDSI